MVLTYCLSMVYKVTTIDNVRYIYYYLRNYDGATVLYSMSYLHKDTKIRDLRF